MICPFCKVDKPGDEFGKSPPTSRYDRWCKSCERNRAMVRRHGLTVDQKNEIAAAQGGCAICGHAEPNSRGWVVDHDHGCCPGEKSCTKCRRGVICSWCNAVLGNAFDRPQILQAAIEYLKRHASGICDWHMPIACAERICGKTEVGIIHGQDGEDLRRLFSPLENESHVCERAQGGREISLDVAGKTR